jgi:hypothetical protein
MISDGSYNSLELPYMEITVIKIGFISCMLKTSLIQICLSFVKAEITF